IICLNEAKCKKEPKIRNYVSYASKIENKNLAQCVTYINKNLIQDPTASYFDIENVHSMINRIELNKKPITIINLYLPPHVNIDVNKLCDEIKNLKASNLVITGDLNAHHYDFGSPNCDSSGKKLVEIFHNLNMIILNDGSP